MRSSRRSWKPRRTGMRIAIPMSGRKPPKLWKRTTKSGGICRILRKLDFRYTPKHGSWLNMAEIEFAVVTKPCLSQRSPDQVTVGQKIAAWETCRNAARATVHWQFTTSKARRKLKALYPRSEEHTSELQS